MAAFTGIPKGATHRPGASWERIWRVGLATFKDAYLPSSFGESRGYHGSTKAGADHDRIEVSSLVDNPPLFHAIPSHCCPFQRLIPTDAVGRQLYITT
jgi:hypothetical protein